MPNESIVPAGSSEISSSRTVYTNQLQELRDDVVAMASMVDKAIARAVDALRTQDVQLAKRVRADDKEINQLRWNGEDRATRLIATQSPVATDLRNITAAMYIFTDLERMGDHAVHIAKAVIATAGEPLLKPLVDIPRMAQIARSMLQDAVTAFIEQNAEAARRAAYRDDEVDVLQDQIIREMLTYMMADPTTIQRATRLLWAVHDIERIADRVTNVCERVVFSVTSEFEELDHRHKTASDNGTSG